MFPYLSLFLKAPSPSRSRFHLVYYLERDGRPVGNVEGKIQDGLTQIPVHVDAHGRIAPLPTLDQLRRKGTISFDVPAKTRLASDAELEPTARPAADMDAPELAAAVNQASTAIRTLAGVFSFAAPRIKRVIFVGVPSGEGVTAGGRSVPLPLTEDGPAYEPERLKGIITLRFPKQPIQLMLTQ